MSWVTPLLWSDSPSEPHRALLSPMLLSEVTTLRVGGPCDDAVAATTEGELIEALTSADAIGRPVLLLAGGSNLVISDAGFEGRVVLVRTEGISSDGDRVSAAAGESWPSFVAAMVAQGRAGVEALSGIPGTVGATPFQNVGAYGQEVADTVRLVRVFDRSTRRIVTLEPGECEFGYRSSVFKADPQRYLILDVTFELPVATHSMPVRYAELARAVDTEVGGVAGIPEVANAVLGLRRGKGMVLDAGDHDTWSAGSFFTNPVIPGRVAEDLLPAEAPRFPAGDDVKTSAAWLIEQAGFHKGFRVRPTAPAAVSYKHTLALTNRGTATAADMLELARTVRDGVLDTFGIELTAEPILVGCAL